jgi:hypothetical protein
MGHGLNVFAYVGNRPLDFVDPSGFIEQDTDAAISIGSSVLASSVDGLRGGLWRTGELPGQLLLVGRKPNCRGRELAGTSFAPSLPGIGAGIGSTSRRDAEPGEVVGAQNRTPPVGGVECR